MYKVLIADDEIHIRQGLASIIPWEELDFQLCGLVENGCAALEVIEQTFPDLLLLDIKMPVMNGIELMDELKKRKLHPRIIVLSGYSEFEYARKALEIGAKTYMLKPVNPNELYKQVSEIRDELVRERELSKTAAYDYARAAETVAIHLLSGNFDRQAVDKLNNEWNFQLPWKLYQLVVTTRSNMSAMNDAILGIFERFGREHLFCLPFCYGQYIGILCGDDYFSYKRETVCEKLTSEINLVSNQHQMLVVGHTTTTHEQIFDTFLTIEKIFQNDFLFRNMRYLIMDSSINRAIPTEPIFDTSVVESMSALIKSGETDKMEWLLEGLRDNFIRNQVNESTIKSLYGSLLSKINQEVPMNSQDMEYRVGNWLLSIQRMNNMESLHGFVKYELQKLMASLSQASPDDKILDVVKYLNENFTNNSLTLKLLADKFWYHPTYLGVLLKKLLRKSFNQYLLDLRLEYAKTLLLSGEKPSVAAEHAGFKDSEYFRKLFKESTGCSPAKFRKQGGR